MFTFKGQGGVRRFPMRLEVESVWGIAELPLTFEQVDQRVPQAEGNERIRIGFSFENTPHLC